jgi:hypothetical protein
MRVKYCKAACTEFNGMQSFTDVSETRSAFTLKEAEKASSTTDSGSIL